jgi:hypothetical protein
MEGRVMRIRLAIFSSLLFLGLLGIGFLMLGRKDGESGRSSVDAALRGNQPEDAGYWIGKWSQESPSPQGLESPAQHKRATNERYRTSDVPGKGAENLTREGPSLAKKEPSLKSGVASPVKSRVAIDPFTPTETSKDTWAEMGGHRLYFERGVKYKILLTIPGNPTGRPFTPEESRRHAETIRRLQELSESNAVDPQELAQLNSQLRSLEAVVWRPPASLVQRMYHPMPGVPEPPDSEAIVIDLRNR